MIPGERQELIGKQKDALQSVRREDIAMLVGAMKLFAWLNMAQGTANIILYGVLTSAGGVLPLTGIFSILICALVYMKIYYMMHTRNWIQISLTAVCGLYIPILMLVISSYYMAIALLN